MYLDGDSRDVIAEHVLSVSDFCKRGMKEKQVIDELERHGFHRDIGEIIYRQGVKLKRAWSLRWEGTLYFGFAIACVVPIVLLTMFCATLFRIVPHILLAPFCICVIEGIRRGCGKFKEASEVRWKAIESAIKKTERTLKWLDEQEQDPVVDVYDD